jgi:hypothetical protein
MDKITENNVVALLEECVANANLGPSSLWLWFLQERPLIERTLLDANFGKDIILEDDDLEEAHILEDGDFE